MEHTVKKIEYTMLNKEFTAITKEFKNFMVGVEAKCVEFDKKYPEATYEEQINFIESQKAIFKQMSDFYYKLQLIAKDFWRAEYLNHQSYLQSELLQYFLRDTMPLNKQMYTKPLGYAGDYIVVNYFFEDGYPGEDTYSKLICRYTLTTPLTRAHIYRRTYFRNYIRKITSTNDSTEEVKISSFACGPAVEMLDILLENKRIDNVKFFCIDAEKGVIEQISRNVKEIEKKTNKSFNVHLFQESIFHLVSRSIIYPDWQNQNFIYCAGFFDYLSERPARRVLAYLYRLLKNDGVLVIVNVYKEHPCKISLEMMAEWHLRCRDEREMFKLTEGISDIRQKTIDFDPTGTNIYLILKK